MALIELTTICLLACVFLLFVLYQWVRDTKRKTTTRFSVRNEVYEMRGKKHPHVVGPWRTAESCDRYKVRSHRAAAATERPRDWEPERDECERMAYERVARSFGAGKRG